MKLAEALMLRADMQKKLASLRQRITRNCVVQEGEKPHEDPGKLMKEAVGLLGELETLVFRINQTNLTHKLSDGRTITEAIARRDAMLQQHSLLHAAIEASGREPDRYSMSEIKWIATVDVSKLQVQIDDLAGKIRELNAQLQQTNWSVDLV